MKRSELFKIREIIEKASASLEDTDALDAVELFPLWAVGVSYSVGERVQYDGKLYKVVQAHTSQADWTPDTTPALFTEVAKPGEIPVWRQPTGAQDVYGYGARVYYPNKGDDIWRSIVDNNSWEPGVYGWEKE